MADSSRHKRTDDDALLASIDRIAREVRWVFSVRDDVVWFGDGLAEVEVPLQDFRTSFQATFLRVATRLRDGRFAKGRVVPPEFAPGVSGPAHEFDRSGRHISEKSG